MNKVAKSNVSCFTILVFLILTSCSSPSELKLTGDSEGVEKISLEAIGEIRNEFSNSEDPALRLDLINVILQLIAVYESNFPERADTLVISADSDFGSLLYSLSGELNLEDCFHNGRVNLSKVWDELADFE